MKDVELLRQHPAIEHVHFVTPGAGYEPNNFRSAAEAWAEYDAK